MRVVSFVYDSADAPAHVEEARELIEARADDPDVVDVAAFDDGDDARREAMLTVKSGVGIGSPPSELYGDDGRPDFSIGALVTEEPTGRRTLHVGRDVLNPLRESE